MAHWCTTELFTDLLISKERFSFEAGADLLQHP